MKIVLAPDSFKGSLSAMQVCQAMEKGIRGVIKKVEIDKIPMADGGEGTVHALISATKGRIERQEVVGPLGTTVTAEYGILGDGRTAVIEMAAASGLPLVPSNQRNPLQTTTYGTGQLILAALKKGCQKIIIGIGGSATTDCGTGMAQALGVRFFKKDGKKISDFMNGCLMDQVRRLDMSGLHPHVKQCDITVACDVDNPLLGERGAVMVYSRQKGANEKQLHVLEENMIHIIDVIEGEIGYSIRDKSGAGAAGGLGAGLMAFMQASLESGVELVLKACDFRKRIANADLVLTGEGRVDNQTAYGKTISGVVREARELLIPVIVIGGSIGDGAENLYEMGVTSMFSICPGPITLQQAIEQSGDLVVKCTERIMRVFAAGYKK